jgi:hypothetical protein
MIKENWIGWSNTWLSRTVDRVDEKIWLSMRCVRKIGEEILSDQNEKRKRKIGRIFWLLKIGNFPI